MILTTADEDALSRADRESRPVRLVFHDGTRADARIRDLDRDKHGTLTYMDMDDACGAKVVRLADIASVEIAEA
jgi:hypothetical protein